MKLQSHSIRKLAIVAAAFLMVIGLNVLMSGIPAVGPIVGVVEDWSTHHMVYTNPGTAAEALAQGRIQQWYRTVTDPRYIMQQMRRNPIQRAMAAAPDFAARMALLRAPFEVSHALPRPKPTPKGNLSKDWNVDVGPIGVGAGNFPAKFSFNSGMSASDIAVFNTSEPGSTTAATVIGLNNLYTTAPSVAFAYNTTTGDTVATSVVFDLAGDQIAFISTNGGHAYLNVLRFETATGNGTAYATPVAPAYTTNSGSTYLSDKSTYPSSSILFRAEFANGATDTNSSPYYDYAADRLWVGDNSGNIHEFTGVFNGGVAESGNPWGTTSATTVLTSPVYDGNTPGYVYVGAANGYMYAFTASSGAKYATSAAITNTTAGLGIVDGPLLDVANSVLYVTFGYDADDDSGVTQVTTPSFGTVSEVYFGPGSTTVPVYNGTFDNTHYTSGGTTGYITTCNYYNELYFNPIAISGFKSGRTEYSSVKGDVYEELTSTTNIACSPQTEIASGGYDYIFLSVANDSEHAPTNGTCATGNACLYSFIVGTYTATSATYTWTTAAAPNYGFEIQKNTTTPSASSTSGIIVDNSASGGGSNIYFTTTTPGTSSPCTTTTADCAIQVSQAAP